MNCLKSLVGILPLVAFLAGNVSAQQLGLGQQQQAGAAQNQTQPGRGQIPIIGAKAAVQAGLARVPQQPFPPLDDRASQYLDQVLNVWEAKTASIERYQCNFVRFEYADATLPPKVHTAYAKGQIKFMAPDKGMFRVDEMKSIANKKAVIENAVRPEYRLDPNRPEGDYWICDGNWVHSLDRNDKKAVRTELPPEYRGKQIYLSPLPFLFGVKAAEIKRRYWIQPVTPPPGDTSVWLEAWPKRSDDAGSYSRVQVVLDRADTLPRAMIVFMPHFDPKKGKTYREIYEFQDRKTHAGFLDKIQEGIWRKDFISTKLPGDWTVIVEPYKPPQDAVEPGQGRPNLKQPRVARPPGQPLNR